MILNPDSSNIIKVAELIRKAHGFTAAGSLIVTSNTGTNAGDLVAYRTG